MPTIRAAKTIVPPHALTQAAVRAFAREHFGPHRADIDRLLPVFDHAAIEKRHFARPLDWFREDHPISEKNQLYIELATSLGTEVCRSLLREEQLAPDAIDAVIYVNTTGLATPTIDARLINRLGLRRDVRRTPLWGLGCAGGAAGLAQAYHYLLGHPAHRVLLVAAEFCSLTFLANDFSKSNFIATALFADGVAAVILEGDAISTGEVHILDARSTFYHDTLDIMGWHVIDDGLQVVFSRRIPQIVHDHIRDDFGAFLREHNLTAADIEAFLLHPGGAKVLAAYTDALSLTADQTVYSRRVLRDFGNMSSVTVLFVLDAFLRDGTPGHDGHALVSALGPGFTSEAVLLRRQRR